eukprot:COSAG02_NODE_7446_length_3009_cov_5.238144_1_plen_52_part_10
MGRPVRDARGRRSHYSHALRAGKRPITSGLKSLYGLYIVIIHTAALSMDSNH